jgi:fibro-slime domain-containing protein
LSLRAPESGLDMLKSRRNGFVLPLTLFMLLGVTAISMGIMFNGKMGRMSATNYKGKIRTFMAADGMVTLLAQELINGNANKYVDMTQYGRIKGKIWTGVTGGSVGTFEAMTKTKPYSDTLSSPYLGSNLGQYNYGIKWTGWIIPPLTGAYTFITRSDDESRFYLSTDAEESNLSNKPICKVEPGWVVEWPNSGPSVSGPIPLEAGHRYYFEYYHKQGDNWDVGQVGWSGPEYFSERPISGQYLSPYKSDAQWKGTTLVGNVPVHYQVSAMGLDAFRINTEAMVTKSGKASDTAYRLPLVQALSLKGPPLPAPPRMYLRVLYRDYTTNSNPEFDGPVATNTVYSNMVQSLITDSTATDAPYFGRNFIYKPTRNLIRPNYNCGLNKWFQDWTPDFTDYAYSTMTDCAKTRPSPAGNTYQHAKIFDSLQFTLDESQGPYTYVYSRMGNVATANPQTSFRGEQLFFPLDYRGVDPAGAAHNFSFCMELHTTFLHQSGLKFEFTGDDDVWVYLNRNLAIDLGGVHMSTNAILNLDDVNWLTYGKTYNLDFFQCERHQFNSTSRIVTNIKMGRPWGRPTSNWHRDYGSMN